MVIARFYFSVRANWYRTEVIAASRPRSWHSIRRNTRTLNAITDVAGVEVGYKTLISGEGRLVVGKGPVRTGVTAILPRGKGNMKSVFAGYFAGNGNGDMTGTHWIEESGLLETPILITNTGSVGVVRDAAVAWLVKEKRPGEFWYPVTAETADWPLNESRDNTSLRRIPGTR